MNNIEKLQEGIFKMRQGILKWNKGASKLIAANYDMQRTLKKLHDML